jgi:hypothetical protein
VDKTGLYVKKPYIWGKVSFEDTHLQVYNSRSKKGLVNNLWIKIS